MKIAIYIEDGTVQLVITPESEFEKSAVKMLVGKPAEVKLFAGSFFDCRGGWVRQSPYYPSSVYGSTPEDQSLILRISEAPPAIEQPLPSTIPGIP